MSGTTVSCVYISQQAQQWHNPRLHKQQPRNSNTTKYFVKYARNLLLLKVETTNLFCHLRQKYKVEYTQAMTANDTTWHHSSTCYLHSMRQEEQTVEEKKKIRERKVFRKRQRAVQGRFDCWQQIWNHLFYFYGLAEDHVRLSKENFCVINLLLHRTSVYF